MTKLDFPLICIQDMDGHQYLVYDTYENRSKLMEWAGEEEVLPEGRTCGNTINVHNFVYDLTKNPFI